MRRTGFDRRTIAKWLRLDALPDRNASALKTSSPRYFEEYLSRRWAEGCVRGRQLFREVKARGYTRSFSNLERLLAKWRCPTRHLARPGRYEARRWIGEGLANAGRRRTLREFLSAGLRCKGCSDDRGEQLVRRGEAAELVTAERAQRAAVSAREFVADHDRQVESFGNCLDAADQIDRGSDDGEIETVGGADISIDRRTGMQRDDDVQWRLAHRGKLVAEPAHRRERLDCRVERVARGLGGGAQRFDGKIASRPSPMGFRISPPWSRMALACASNRALSNAIMRSPGRRSERAVKPRRSETTARR